MSLVSVLVLRFPRALHRVSVAAPKTRVEEQLEVAAQSHTASGFMYERYEHRRVRTAKTVLTQCDYPFLPTVTGVPPGVAPDSDICDTPLASCMLFDG